MEARDLFGLVGSTLADKYRVERVLGEGGFGVVYAGTHLLLGVPIAIKCLKPTASTPQDRERGAQAFQREARILFTLGHPAIVRLYDVGVVPGQLVPYAVLELLRGTTLADEIRARTAARRPFPREEILGIFGPILEAVGFAHERGVIHRDLKPANMMLVSEGSRFMPKVLDFGTARGDAAATGPVGAPTSAMTQGTGAFTPLYAAPEQWDGTYGSTGPHTDVFALGLTLAEACLLRYPLGDPDSILAIFRATTDESTRPRIAAIRTDLPMELEQVIAKALRVRIEHRFADAREMLAAFRGALNASPTTAPLARPLSAPAPAGPPPGSAPPGAYGSAPPGFGSGSPPPGFGPSYGPPNHVILASTTQPHSMTATRGPMRSGGSVLPWLVGAAGILVALVALGLGAFVVLRDSSLVATPAPVAQPHAGSPPLPAPPTATTPAPVTPAPGVPAGTAGKPGTVKPLAGGPTPTLVLADAIGMDPFWTKGEILNVLRANHGSVVACTRESAALDPKLSGEVSVTVTPRKDGVVTSSDCAIPKVNTPAAAQLCSCIDAAMSGMRFPPAHGKLGLLDSAPFIVDYRLSPAP